MSAKEKGKLQKNPSDFFARCFYLLEVSAEVFVILYTIRETLFY